IDDLVAPWSVGVFEVAVDDQDANVTQTQLSRVVDEARRLRQVSWCVTVMVVSDDSVFLAAFAEWSLKGRLLEWSTRLLIVTRLPLQELHHLYKLLSMTNSMLLIVESACENHKCSLYLRLPYTSLEARGLRVASWTPHRGLVLTTQLPLFPHKFTRFLQRPDLVVASEKSPMNFVTTIDAHEDCGSQRFIITGPVNTLVDYLAKALNFSYTYVRPPDGSWGKRYKNGSWSGMVGMVVRKEADIGAGPFSVSGTRAHVIDYTTPMLVEYSRMFGGRGLPLVDPWGFLLPLAPLVWAGILTALLVLPLMVFLLHYWFSKMINGQDGWSKITFTFLRILFQQVKLKLKLIFAEGCVLVQAVDISFPFILSEFIYTFPSGSKGGLCKCNN
ncbi:glutamate receptor-like, partial [Homarus americanus]|uniref:glutamate receptor-like n=1 Tax=Homarus americanus TaxID=6706 RepID=UPI001C47F911